MYDKKRFNKVEDKKLLHKIGKQWAVIGLSSLLLIAAPLVLPNAVHASTAKQAAVKVQANPHQSALDEAHRTAGDTKNQSISDQAEQMHQDLLNHAAKNQNNADTTMQLGAWRHRRRSYRRNKRSTWKNYRKASYRKNHKQNRRGRHITRRRNKRSHGKRRNLKRRQSRRGKRQVRKARAKKHTRRTSTRRRNRKMNRRQTKRTSMRGKRYMIQDRNGSDYIFPTKSLNSLRNGKELSESDYDEVSDNYKPLVNVIGSTNINGFNFNQIKSHTYYANGWVFSNELSRSRHGKFNGNIISKFSKSIKQSIHNTKVNKFNETFTPSEREQIGSIQAQCRSLSAKNKCLEKAVNKSDSSFQIQDHPDLVNQYRQLEIDWVNFYRNMYGLPEAQENSADDQLAQTHAENNSDPDDMSNDAPMSPQGDVNGYFTDAADADDDGMAGHRNTIIDYSTNLGVGVSGGNSDNNTAVLYSDGHDNSSDIRTDMGMDGAVAYPKPGLFPYSDAKDANQWSLCTDGNLGNQSSTVTNSDGSTTTTTQMGLLTYFCNSDNQPYPDLSVSVHDNTDNVDVPTSNIVTDSEITGNGLYYEVNKNYIKPDHSYTITVSGIHNYGPGTYSYTTKLYHLNDNNA